MRKLMRAIWHPLLSWQYRRATQYTLQIQDSKILFSLEDDYSVMWFLPRYDNNKIHEPIVTILLSSLLRRAKGFIDVGAHIGYYSCIAAKMLGDQGEVYAFEMDSRSHALAQKNLAMNGSARPVVHAAVSDSDGSVTYSRPRRWSGPLLSLADQGHAEHVTVRSVSLDAYFETRLPTPLVIKIDVEGAEHKVLSGMSTLLGREDQQLDILLEVHGSKLKALGSSERTVLQLLWDAGFTIYDLYRFRNAEFEEEWPRISPRSPVQLRPNSFVYATRTSPPSQSELRAVRYSSRWESVQ